MTQFNDNSDSRDSSDSHDSSDSSEGSDSSDQIPLYTKKLKPTSTYLSMWQ